VNRQEGKKLVGELVVAKIPREGLYIGILIDQILPPGKVWKGHILIKGVIMPGIWNYTGTKPEIYRHNIGEAIRADGRNIRKPESDMVLGMVGRTYLTAVEDILEIKERVAVTLFYEGIFGARVKFRSVILGRHLLYWALESLNHRDRRILEMRFGLHGPDYTRKEIAGKFHLTPDRIRQIEGRALRKFRHPNYSRELRKALEEGKSP